ncbi:MAG: hypothetical protein JO002_04320 [Burkholderiaceae bacterium]|nr:hypothetical protein [Burkholderiaceae bacterium]
MEWLEGVVITGHGVASGRAADSPYPAGSISLQLPHFLKAGIDLSPYFSGTLNVDLAPHLPQAKRIVFDGVLHWHGDIAERFTLARVDFRIAAREVEGLWYYPHPETKPAHFQRTSVVELLLPYIAGVAAGDSVSLRF